MLKYLFVLLVLFSISNCAKTEYFLKSVDHKVRFTSFSEEEGYKLKKRFELSHTRINLFWGLTNVYKKDLDTILSPEFHNPEKEGIGNLSINESYDFFDSLLDFALIGIVRPYTVVIKGSLYEKVSNVENTTDKPLDEINSEHAEETKEVKPESKTKKGKGKSK